MALQFFLTYHGVRVKADEPALDWKSIAQILKRSDKFEGITYLVTSELEFANNFVNILDQIKADGISGKAILEIFSKENATRDWVQKFTGQIDLIGSVKTISATGLEKYKVNTNPTGFEVDFVNNFDVDANITDSTDLFGNAITPFSKVSEYVKLEPLSIKQRLDVENEIPNLYDVGSDLDIDDDNRFLWFWTMNYANENIQEFEGNYQNNATLGYDDLSYGVPLSVTNLEAIGDAPHSPINNGLYVLKVPVNGDYRVQFNYSLNMVIDCVFDGTFKEQILNYRYVMLIAIVDRTDPLNPAINIDLLNEDIVSNVNQVKVEFSKNASIDKTYTLAANNEIYIFPYMLIQGEHTNPILNKYSINIFTIDFSILTLKINGITKFNETNPQTYLIHELFSRLVNKITGKFNAFQSDFYGRTDSEPRTYASDGEGSLTAILGGTHLRGWKIGTSGGNQRSLNVSFSGLFESEKAKHNLGVGIVDGIVRIEKAEFFVDKTNSSASLGCIREMEIQTEPKSFYNEYEFGYSEWKNKENKSGAGLQEFNAKNTYNPQLSVINSKYLAVSKYVAAGYAIETTRRQQRDLDTEKETEYDLKKFMIALLRRSGDGSASNPNFINETYDPLDGSNPWQSVSGVDFPEEVYNVRWHPARMARNHGNKIRLSVLQNSNDTFLIQTIDGNKLFSSQLKTESSPVIEGEDIAGIDLGDPLFTGQKFIFTTELTDAQIDGIISNPYYHIIFEDINGNEIKGVIEGDMSLPFDTNVGEFTLKEIYE